MLRPVQVGCKPYESMVTTYQLGILQAVGGSIMWGSIFLSYIFHMQSKTSIFVWLMASSFTLGISVCPADDSFKTRIGHLDYRIFTLWGISRLSSIDTSVYKTAFQLQNCGWQS